MGLNHRVGMFDLPLCCGTIAHPWHRHVLAAACTRAFETALGRTPRCSARAPPKITRAPEQKIARCTSTRHRFAPTSALLAGFRVLTVPTMFATIMAPSGSLDLILVACSRTHQLSDCGCGAYLPP